MSTGTNRRIHRCYPERVDAVTAALAGLVDYAGLFPPAGLPLDVVIDQYGRYRIGRHAWMLGRLVVPAERLADAEAAASRAGASVDEPWRVSALVGTAAQSEAIAATMIADHRRPRSVRVEAVEAVAGSADDIARLAHVWPSEFERYVEIPADPDPAPLAVAGQHGPERERRGQREAQPLEGDGVAHEDGHRPPQARLPASVGCRRRVGRRPHHDQRAEERDDAAEEEGKEARARLAVIDDFSVGLCDVRDQAGSKCQPRPSADGCAER